MSFERQQRLADTTKETVMKKTVLFGMLMLGIGYGLGLSNMGPTSAKAQDGDVGISQETGDKIRAANKALNEAMESLQSEGKYESITEGINSFLVLSGGGSARADLESGRGVDPETFAALYAGRAIPEIQDLLGTDDQNRITYNNEVIRLYSKSRLRQILANRVKVTEVGL